MSTLAMPSTEELESLKESIRHHEYCYHVLSEPEISDYEFDQLFDQLKGIEKAFPELITPDSPTQRVGEKALECFAKANHGIPMLSIENTYNMEGFNSWLKRITDKVGECVLVIEPKFDGIAFSATYEDDMLVQVLTRGNGKTGDDITQNFKTIKDFPLSANFSKWGISKIEVRGEIYMTRSEFEAWNEERVANGDKPAANPRNAASGSAKLLDPQIVAKRPLRAVAHSFGAIEANESGEGWLRLKYHHTTMKLFQDLGIPAVQGKVIKKDAYEEIEPYFDQIKTRKLDLFPFDIDGVVVKVNKVGFRRKIGSTDHHPRWVTAFKFPPDQATTMLEEITFQVGRTGAVTPVANLTPVKLSGTTVARATLHNADQIERLGVREKDYVVIEKCGEIIPAVVRVVDDEKHPRGEKKFEFPKVCPCHEQAPLTRPEGEAAHYCTSQTCKAQILGRLEHWVSKQCLDIRSIGPALIESLCEGENGIRSIDQLYTLNNKKLSSLPRMGDTSSKKILQEIEKSKKAETWRILHGFGIKMVGQRTAQTIMDAYSSIDDLMFPEINLEENLQELPDIGPKVAKNICEWFEVPTNRKMVLRLKDCGIKMEQKKIEKLSDKLADKTMVVTGGLENFDREGIKSFLQSHGAKVTGSVSKKTDILICGESPGSKLSKAESLGIPVWSESELMTFLEVEE